MFAAMEELYGAEDEQQLDALKLAKRPDSSSSMLGPLVRVLCTE